MNWTSPWFLLWALAWLLAACALPRRWQGPAGLLVGAGFLAWADWRGLAAIVGGALICWMLLRGTPDWRRSLAAAALVAGGLVAAKWGVRVDGDGVVALLGTAFAALRLIHVAIDSALGRVSCADLGGFMRYLLFLPALIAGPLHRLDEQQRDERRRRWDPALFSAGAERVLHGLAKIVILSGWIGDEVLGKVPVDRLHPALAGWFACLHYGWNLYFQFSGYSDVAIGLALTAGYRLPENFRFPFLAADIQDFWRRWHASLSAWCRGYVAEPVLASTRNRWLAVVASMLVLGLWHELTLRYCVWGLYHGLGIAVCQRWIAWRTARTDSGGGWLRRSLAVILTQAFVLLGFAITGSNGLDEAWHQILRMLLLEGR